MRILAFIVLFTLPSISFGQTVIVEKDGTLTAHEKESVKKINKSVIPAPDTVAIRDIEGFLGRIKITSPMTIELSPKRRKSTDKVRINEVYLYGQTDADSAKVPPQTHILLHEMGHIISSKLYFPILNRLNPEREAEIIGLVIGRMFFNIRRGNIGFPDSIQVQGERKSIKGLRQRYCQIIKTNWKVYDAEC